MLAAAGEDSGREWRRREKVLIEREVEETASWGDLFGGGARDPAVAAARDESTPTLLARWMLLLDLTGDCSPSLSLLDSFDRREPGIAFQFCRARKANLLAAAASLSPPTPGELSSAGLACGLPPPHQLCGHGPRLFNSLV